MKRLKNHITDNTPLENRYTIHFQNRINISLIILIIKINDLNNKIIKNKNNIYYTAFLAGSEPFKDFIILIKVLSRFIKEVNK